MRRIFLALLVGHLIYIFPLAAVIFGLFMPGEDAPDKWFWICVYETFALLVSTVVYLADTEKWKNGE